MKATLEYDDHRQVEVDIPYEHLVPLLSFDDKLFVLRAFVMGIIDNKSREGTNGLLYHETTPIICKPERLNG